MSAGLSVAEQAQINILLGGVVVGNYLSYLTMGIVLSSAWTYFTNFPADRWWFKALVILCVSMCIGDTIGTGIWSYDWAVANYGNPAALTFTHWGLSAESFFFGSCGLAVQLFYAWRVWIISMRKNWILPVVIGCLSILSWCLICWMIHIPGTHKSISDFALARPAAYIWFGGSVGADVLITSSMIYYLDLRFRMKPEFPSGVSANWFFHRRLRKLIVQTVECNFLSLFAQAFILGFVSYSKFGFYYVAMGMMLAKISTFSLLVSLNGRHTDNGHGTNEGGYLFRGDRGVELPVFATSSIPSTQVSTHIQQGDLEG